MHGSSGLPAPPGARSQACRRHQHGHSVRAGFVPAMVASALVTRHDLSALADTRRGRYVMGHMPPAAQALRLAGQVVVWRAEYQHRMAGIVFGHALVAAGWSHGLLASACPCALP